MILERKTQINIPDIKQQLGEFRNNFLNNSFDGQRLSILEFAGIIQVYSGAMKGISTKLEVLDDEFHIHYSHNPIHRLLR